MTMDMIRRRQRMAEAAAGVAPRRGGGRRSLVVVERFSGGRTSTLRGTPDEVRDLREAAAEVRKIERERGLGWRVAR